MRKIMAKKDHVVVKSFRSPSGMDVMGISTVGPHKTILWKGTKVECKVWARTKNDGHRVLVQEWADLREKLRVPLPSDDIGLISERLEQLQKTIVEMLGVELPSIKSQNGVAVPAPTSFVHSQDKPKEQGISY